MKTIVTSNEISQSLDCSSSLETCGPSTSLCCRIAKIDHILFLSNLAVTVIYLITFLISTCCIVSAAKPKKKLKKRAKKQPKGDEEKDSLLHSISNELNVSNNNNISINKEVPLSWCERFKEVFYNIVTLNLCIAIIFIMLMKIGEYLFIVSNSFLFFSFVNLCELMLVVLALFTGVMYGGNLIPFYIIDIMVIFSLIFMAALNCFVLDDYFVRAHLVFGAFAAMAFILGFIKALYVNLVITKDIEASEVNLNRDLLDNYVRGLPGENIELYRETNRVMDMCKLYELITKLRAKRKEIMNMGVFVLFSFLILSILANFMLYMRTEKVGKVSTLFNINFGHDELLPPVTNGNSMKALIVLVNEKDFDMTNANNSTTWTRLNVTKRNNVVNYISEILTGSKPELTGIIGNKLDTKRLRRFDSIKNSLFILGNKYDEFIKNNFISYNLVNYPDEDNITDDTKMELFWSKRDNSRLSFLLLGNNTKTSLSYIDTLSTNSSMKDSVIVVIPMGEDHIYIVDKTREKPLKLNEAAKNKIYSIADISATLSTLLNIGLPKQNQGKYILSLLPEGISAENKKDLFLKLRNQLRNLYVHTLKSLSSTTKYNFTADIDKLNLYTRSNGTQTLYTNDIKEITFNYNSTIAHMENWEITTNLIYSLLLCLVVIFILSSYLQHFTFANLIAIFSINLYGNLNLVAFSSSLVIICIHFFVSLFVIFIYLSKHIFISSLASIALAFLLIQIYLFFFIYYTRCFSGIQSAIIKANGLALLYLFRVYSVLISIIFSLVIFAGNSMYHFAFSDPNIISFFIYKTTDITDSLNSFGYKILILLLFQIVLISDFASYPKWNKNKQIFDSLFVLSDLKMMDNDVDKNNMSYEKEALESNFVKLYTNYDNQSEICYKKKKGSVKYDNENIMIDALIMNNFLNNKIDLVKLENGKDSMEIMKLDERIFGKNNNITYDYLRSVFSSQKQNN